MRVPTWWHQTLVSGFSGKAHGYTCCKSHCLLEAMKYKTVFSYTEGVISHSKEEIVPPLLGSFGKGQINQSYRKKLKKSETVLKFDGKTLKIIFIITLSERQSKKGRQGERQKEDGREFGEDLLSKSVLPKCSQWQRWTRQKLGPWNSTWACNVGSRGPKHLRHHCTIQRGTWTGNWMNSGGPGTWTQHANTGCRHTK